MPLTMDKLILNPSIPYVGPIYGAFDPGKVIRIRGTALEFAFRFDINLQCGPAAVPGDDVALQVSINILKGFISLNSLLNGKCGKEQRGNAITIKRAEKFEIVIMSDLNQYKVAVNNQHCCEFPQRTPYDRVTHLGINGNVAISEISYESAAGNIRANEAATAPEAIPVRNSRSEDFELVEFTNSRTPSPGMQAPYPPGIVPPPCIPPPPGIGPPPPYSNLTPANVGNTKSQPVISTLVGSSHPSPQRPSSTHSTMSAPYPANLPAGGHRVSHSNSNTSIYNSMGLPYLVNPGGTSPEMDPSNNSGIFNPSRTPYPVNSLTASPGMAPSINKCIYNSNSASYSMNSPGPGPRIPPLNNMPYPNRPGAPTTIAPPLNVAPVGTTHCSSNILHRKRSQYLVCGGVVLSVVLFLLTVFLKFIKLRTRQGKGLK